MKIFIENNSGNREGIELPEGINLSLMELLRATGHAVPATCGGIALCATCLIEIIEGSESVSPPNDNELMLLETLPFDSENYRLSCQLRADEAMAGCVIRLAFDQ